MKGVCWISKVERLAGVITFGEVMVEITMKTRREIVKDNERKHEMKNSIQNKHNLKEIRTALAAIQC